MELRHLKDDVLLVRLQTLVSQERESVAEIVEHLAEVERRDIVIGAGFSGLFDYCVKILGYSEPAAFLRVRAARASQEFPRVLEDLRTGKLHLDAVMRLYPHLTSDNCDQVLDLAAGATKREVMRIAADLAPEEKAPERDVIKPLPPSPAKPSETNEPTVIAPASRNRLAFTADDDFIMVLERWKGFRRHKHPEGRLEDVFKDAMLFALGKLDPAREVKSTRRSRPTGRRIPAEVKRTVWSRDGGRCVYVAKDGRRCESTQMLEYDHIKPWSLGGASTIENLRLLCRPHNQWLGRLRFGDRRKRASLRPDAPAHGVSRTSP